MTGTGRNIKRLRESRNLTQADIAKIAGVTDKAVSTWENGLKEPRMGAIEKIASYFGVKLTDIIGDEDITKVIDGVPKAKGESPEEQQLLEIYRQLDETGRAALLAAARGFLKSFARGRGGNQDRSSEIA